MIDINGLMTMMSVCVEKARIHEEVRESHRAKAVSPNTYVPSIVAILDHSLVSFC
jgi:hypothetical protein